MDKQQSLRKVDLPFYGYFKALVFSFFSPRLYVDVGKRWKGLSIGYLLLMVFIFVIPFSARMLFSFMNFFENQLLYPLEQIPPLFIQNGVVSLDKPMPYPIKNKAGKTAIIIDTTGRINAIDKTNPDLTILITKDKFIFRILPPSFFFSASTPQQSAPYIYPLNKNINQVLDGRQLVSAVGLQWVKHGLQLMVYPAIALSFFVIYLIIFLVFALMGQLLGQLFFKLSINYRQTFRLLIVSATPALFVFWILLAFNSLFSGLGVLLLLLLIGYFFFALYSLKRESHKLVVS